jgi:hypothetical protein
VDLFNMAFDWITTLAILLQVSQSGSLPWLLAILVALNFGASVLAARTLYRAYKHRRRAAQVGARLGRGNHRH